MNLNLRLLSLSLTFITFSKLASSSDTSSNEVGALQHNLELITSNTTLNESYFVHPFECEVNGLSKADIDAILARNNQSMLVTVLAGDNTSYTLDKENGDRVYNLELTAVSNTLHVKGQALLNNTDKNVNESSLSGSRCQVIIEDSDESNDSSQSRTQQSGKPEILSSYNHIVLMNGAPEQVISCTARGAPTPQIRWFSYDPSTNAKVLLESNLKQENASSTTSYLLFPQVSNTTSGNYTCLAENAIGRDEKTFEVEVISVRAINPHCNDLDTTPPLSLFGGDGNTLHENPQFQEILRRSKRYLWNQLRDNREFRSPYYDPFTFGNRDSRGSDNGIKYSDLQRMVNFMTERLLLADKVAVSKWDSGTPVEDPPRERIILDNMVRQAHNRGLEASWAFQYFRDQIEANKDIQYELIRLWHLDGRRPPGPPVDLGTEVRPKIDEINNQLMELASRTEYERRQWRCKQEVERNARYSTFLYNLDSLHQKALERAVGNMCISPNPPRVPSSTSPYYRFHQVVPRLPDGPF